MLSFNYSRTPNVFVNVNVGAKNHNIKFSLILDEYNIMIVMQKFKFKQEFTSAFNVECLHSSLQAKLLMHNSARAKKKNKRKRKKNIGLLVDFGLNEPLRQYFSLYRVVSQREGERGEKG